MVRESSQERTEQLIAALEPLSKVAQRPEGLQPADILAFADDAVPHTEAVGMTLVPAGKRPRTVASTAPLAARVDDIQYEAGEGPCLESLETDDLVTVDALSDDQRWRTFGPRCADETGVQAMFSVRLFLTEQDRAALNFYASDVAAFDHVDHAVGAILAPLATITLQASIDHERAVHLRQALTNSRLIGAAIGILMSSRLLTQDQAFDALSQASQRLNRKLHDIAQEVAETGRLPEPPASKRRQRG